MLKIKYYICERDLILVASGRIELATFYKKKPRQCADRFCDNDCIAIYLTTDHPDKDGKGKRPRKTVEGNRKKRQAPRKVLPRNSRNRRAGR